MSQESEAAAFPGVTSRDNLHLTTHHKYKVTSHISSQVFRVSEEEMAQLMTTQQIGSLYPRQLLQGSVNARLGSFCRVFCDEKKFGHKKLFNVAQSSCAQPLSSPALAPRVPVVSATLSPKCQFSLASIEYLLELIPYTHLFSCNEY